ncbi:MAG: polysaccharide deacetylase family protein [Gammaproteobacteria bacterium]|nr:polysaccharide deacetylase family protein [Gammaproteobacteria bacterium]NNC58032.1 polysaccharide deacetylase family protein [Woeseiaceae bacterium]NNL50007.1 polysaccharide deacetylase family protein [Woeseiaceae bacterium]
MNTAKEIISSVIAALGIPAVIRNLNQRKAGILLYHDPEPSVFDTHLDYLTTHYNVVPFERLVGALISRDWSDMPSNAIVLHLDDGYRRNTELAAICERYGVIPTLYLCSHVVGTQRRFWSKLDGGRSKRLRLVENTRLLEKLRDEADYTPDREYEGREALSKSELSAIAHQFDYQSHGRYHFSMVTLNEAELVKEAEESRSRIEELTAQTCEHFSFPYGDYSEREINAVRAVGYKTGRTTRPGWVGPNTDPYQLPIVADVPGAISTNQLRLQLTGLPRITKRFIYAYLTRHLYAIRERRLMSRRVF